MSYIVAYEYFDDSGDYRGNWTDCYEIFETYSEMIDWIGEMEFRDSSSYKWKHILSSDKNLLDICWKDIDNKRNELVEKKKKDDMIKAELAKQKAEEIERGREIRERALLEELMKKYGVK